MMMILTSTKLKIYGKRPNLKVKIKLTQVVVEVPMVTVFPEKNFTCFIFSNKFLLTILLIFILSSGYDLFCLALPQVE